VGPGDVADAVRGGSRGGYANGDQQRRRIVDETLRQLEDHAFGALTVSGLADAVGISAPGLLRHYSSTNAILVAAIERMIAEQSEWIRANTIDLANARDLIRLARRDAATPAYVELFAGLAGPAANPEHPGHDFFRSRYATVEAVLTTGRTAPGTGALSTIAIWDGLQVHALLDATVSVPNVLEYALLGSDISIDRDRVRGVPDATGTEVGPVPGYAVGRDRRQTIIHGATEVFARCGYHAVSMRALAEEVGLPKSSITHYFATKEQLLEAVLAHRDVSILPAPDGRSATARETLSALADSAASTRDRPGLIAVYAVLSSEAVASSHPAHDYFVRRMHRVRQFLEDLFTRAEAEHQLRPGRDPAAEALVFAALWDGLQIRWLYEPGRVRIADELRAHLTRVLV
jgi:AcrR family transcriptional regulator